MDTETTKLEDGIKVYEIGYHLIPTIAEEKVGGEVETIKSLISKSKGEFISDEFPKLRPLAYMMPTQVSGVRHKFTEAYFGWIKFQIESDKLADIKKALDGNEKILRYLLITTIRENTYLGQKAIPQVKEETSEEVTKAPETVVEGEAPVSVEEIDKSIDDLVKEA